MGLGGMISSMGSFGKRSLIGAGIGAGLGFMNTGDLGGMIGGAGAGAAFGGMGYNALRYGVGNKMSGAVGKGMGLGIRGLGYTSGKLGMGATKFSNPNVRKGFATAAKGSRMATQGAISANRFMGKYSTQVNQWGGRALAAAGMGSAAYMGSSVISSNRGY